MKIEPGYFTVHVDGELTDEHPKLYKTIHLVYEFKDSDGLDRKKVETAVNLSQEKY